MRNLFPLTLVSTLALGGACIIESADEDDTDTDTDSSGGPVTATMGESESATTSPTSSSGGEGSSGDPSGSSGTSGDDPTGDPGDQVGSCREEPLEQCLDYVGDGYVPEAFPMGCPNTFSEDPCPTEGVVFSCVFFQGDPLESIGRYYSPWSSKGAAQDCDQASGVPL